MSSIGNIIRSTDKLKGVFAHQIKPPAPPKPKLSKAARKQAHDELMDNSKAAAEAGTDPTTLF